MIGGCVPRSDEVDRRGLKCVAPLDQGPEVDASSDLIHGDGSDFPGEAKGDESRGRRGECAGKENGD
jgi:hypothetical protein